MRETSRHNVSRIFIYKRPTSRENNKYNKHKILEMKKLCLLYLLFSF